jgi:hypothetical protein
VPTAVASNGFIAWFFWRFMEAVLSGGESADATADAGGGSGSTIGVVILCVFMIPFAVAGLAQVGLALMTVCGRISVSVDRGQGRVFRGIGRLGRSKRFDWQSVRKITSVGDAEKMPLPIAVPGLTPFAIEGSRRVIVGRLLTPDRSRFVAAALRRMLAERDEFNRGRF